MNGGIDKRRRNKPYTVGEATRIINERLGTDLSIVTIRDYCRRGILPSIQLMGPGGWHRIPASELERFIETRTKGLDIGDAGV